MKTLSIYKKNVKKLKSLLILYIPIFSLIIVTILLFFPFLDSYIDRNSLLKIFLNTKLVFSIIIVLVILKNFFNEMMGLVENYALKKDTIKNYQWIIRKENLSIFIKTLLILTPFVALTSYNIFTVTETNANFDNLAITLMPEIMQFNLDNLKFFYKKIFTLVAFFAWSALTSVVFGLIAYVFYKISIKRFCEKLNEQLKSISKNSENTEQIKEMFFEDELVFMREKDENEKAFIFERNFNVLNFIKSLEYYRQKEVKKSTCPPIAW